MKKIICLFLAIALMLPLGACGGSSSSQATPSVSASPTIVPTATPIPTPSPTAVPTEIPNADSRADAIPESEIEWTTFSYTATDSEGYSFETTVKMSPWILLTNTDIINAAWSEVSQGYELPGLGEWGLDRSGNYLIGPNASFIYEMTDMYYCVGSIQVKNITSGWDISKDYPRAVREQIYYKPYDLSVFRNNLYPPSTLSLTKIFYSNTTEDSGDRVDLNFTMKSNKINPVPFIFMAPEKFTPNSPDGEYYEEILKGHFYYNSLTQVWDYNGEKPSNKSETPFYIGLIGKDGQYVPPASNLEPLIIRPDVTILF